MKVRERSDDLFYLATKFATIANVELEKNILGFSEKAIDFLSGLFRKMKEHVIQ